MEVHENTPTGETHRYQLGECVGRGGLGTVFRAWDARLGRWVAVKRLRTETTLDADNLRLNMSREANALAALQHANVVTVYDFDVDEEGPFVIMEFIEGQTLDACVEIAPFDHASFLSLAEQVLAGVEAAHHAGLLHRDLKPGNIMLAALPDGAFQVKLLDFGLAKFAVRPTEQTVDHTHALFGSIHFMAPEQFNRAPLDARTDLYALGCVFYYTLTGRPPFNGDTMAETMASHLRHDVRDLLRLRPDLPAHTAGWVMRLMSLDPADRPASATEALALLRTGHPEAAVVGRTRAGTDGRPLFRFPARALAGLGVIVAVAGTGGYFLWHRTVPTPSTHSPALPSVSLFANVPVAHAKGRVPGCFTILRVGDQHSALAVGYVISGSAKNGIDYEKIPQTQTIPAGEASAKILVVPVNETDPKRDERHVRLTLTPADTYAVATSNEVKVKILYEH